MNAGAALLLLFFLHGEIGEWGGDNVQFLLLAESIARGEGYVDLQSPGNPPHGLYPPIFPLLLAPFVAASAPLIVIKLWVALLGIAGLNICYLFLRRYQDRTVSFLIVSSTLCCGVYLDPAFSIMSEGPYFLMSLLCIFFARNLVSEGKKPFPATVGVGVLISLAILTRTIGVVLAPAAVLYLWSHKGSSLPLREKVVRICLLCVLVGLPAGSWFLRSLTISSETGLTYFKEIAESVEETEGLESLTETTPSGNPVLAAEDLWYRIWNACPPRFIEDLGTKWAALFSAAFLAICIVLAILIGIGFVRAVFGRRDIHDFYFVFYALVLVLWKSAGFRLVMPILPFLLLYAYEGAEFLVSSFFRVVRRRAAEAAAPAGRRAGIRLLAILVVANLCVTLWFPVFHYRLAGIYLLWWQNSIKCVHELGEVARKGEVAISLPNNLPYYLIGMKAVPPPDAMNRPEEMLAAILRTDARYLIVNEFLVYRRDGRILFAVEQFPEHFREITGHGDVRIYSILPEPDASLSDPDTVPPDSDESPSDTDG